MILTKSIQNDFSNLFQTGVFQSQIRDTIDNTARVYSYGDEISIVLVFDTITVEQDAVLTGLIQAHPAAILQYQIRMPVVSFESPRSFNYKKDTTVVNSIAFVPVLDVALPQLPVGAYRVVASADYNYSNRVNTLSLQLRYQRDGDGVDVTGANVAVVTKQIIMDTFTANTGGLVQNYHSYHTVRYLQVDAIVTSHLVMECACMDVTDTAMVKNVVLEFCKLD